MECVINDFQSFSYLSVQGKKQQKNFPRKDDFYFYTFLLKNNPESKSFSHINLRNEKKAKEQYDSGWGGPENLYSLLERNEKKESLPCV